MNNRKIILLILGFTLFSALMFYPIYQQFAHAQTRANDVMDVEIPSDDIAPLVSSLTNQWSSTLLANDGWLHVEEQHLRDMESAGFLPNGEEIPLDFIRDGWYYLNSDGLVEKAVVLMKTLDGKLVQETVFKGGSWTNLTTEDFFQREPFHFDLYFGFVERVSPGSTVYDEVSGLEVNNGDTWRLSVIGREDYEGAIELAGVSVPVISIEHRGVFDGDSGALLSLSTVGIGENGEEYEIEVVTYLSLERSQPPTDILIYLSEVSQ